MSTAHALNVAPGPAETRGHIIVLELLAAAKLLRYRIFFVCLSILIISLIAALLVRPLWNSQSDLLVLIGPEYGYRAAVGEPATVTAAFDHDEILGTEIGILTSRDLHRDVVRQVGLARIYPDQATAPSALRRAFTALGQLPAALAARATGTQAPPARPPDPVEAAIERFDAHFTTLGERQASIIRIGFAHPDPAMAQQVLQTLETLYFARRAKLYADSQSGEIDHEVERMHQQLAQAEQRLTEFKASSGITNFPLRLEILLNQQGAAERDLQEAENQVAQNQARLASLSGQTGKTPAEITESRGSELDVRLASLRASLDILRGRRQELLAQYQPLSLPVRAIDEQIAARSAELDAAFADRRPGTIRLGINPVFIAGSTDQLRTQAELRAAMARQQVDETQLATTSREIAALNAHERTLTELERARQVLEDGYKDATRARDTRHVAEQVSEKRQGDVRVIRQPDLPLRPAPTRRLIMLSGVMLCLFAAAAIVIISNFMRRSFLLPVSLETDCDIPVLATVAEAPPRSAPLFSADSARGL